MCPIGIAPHSIRALPLDYICEISEYARDRNMRVDMHVAEQPAEIEACLAEHRRRPVELLQQNGILDSHFTAVHAIHITQEETDLLGAAKSAVCACPTTERNLGDGAVPADRLIDAGVRICLGSDSNAQIDILEDARSLEYHLRMNRLERAVISPEQLFQAATGKADLQPEPDFFTVDLDDPSLAGADEKSLMSQVIFGCGRSAIREVSVGGQRIVEGGHHALQEEVIRQFAAVQQRLWN
jgi:formimidoylglutamate deiminase